MFFGKSDKSIYHVAIYIGDNKMVEAPSHFTNCTGKFVCETGLRQKELIQTACRMWEKDKEAKASAMRLPAWLNEVLA